MSRLQLPPEEQTGVQKVMTLGRWTVDVRAWRFWITVGFIALAGDHTGLWDVDSILTDDGLDVTQMTVMISSIMALLSSLPKKQPRRRHDD